MILKLSPSCPPDALTVGKTITLSANPTGGTEPYTYSFWKTLDGVNRKILQTGSVNMTKYNLISEDEGTPTFGLTLVDSCPSGSKTVEEYCTLSVKALQCTPVSANLSIS